MVPGQNWLRAAGPKMAAANDGNDSEGSPSAGCHEILGTQKSWSHLFTSPIISHHLPLPEVILGSASCFLGSIGSIGAKA